MLARSALGRFLLVALMRRSRGGDGLRRPVAVPGGRAGRAGAGAGGGLGAADPAGAARPARAWPPATWSRWRRRPGLRRWPSTRSRAPVSPSSAVELVFGVLARAAQVAWPAWIMLGRMPRCCWSSRAVRSLTDPDSDRRWQLPGELGGFAWPWIGACLAVIPLLVYFLAYVPYLQLGHPIAGPSAGPGYGWSLDELHAQMFGYHFGLQAGPPFVVAVVELAARPEAGLVLRARLRRAARRRHLQRRQPDPVLGRRAGHRLVRGCRPGGGAHRRWCCWWWPSPSSSCPGPGSSAPRSTTTT